MPGDKLTLADKTRIVREREASEVREDVKRLLKEIDAKVDDIQDPRVLKRYRTNCVNTLNEKRQIITEENNSEHKRRALEYYHKNKERAMLNQRKRRQKIRDARLETNN